MKRTRSKMESRHQRTHRPSQQTVFLLLSALLVSCTVSVFQRVEAVDDGGCIQQLSAFDADGNEKLDREEFANAMTGLSGLNSAGGGYPSSSYLPRNYQRLFEVLSCQCLRNPSAHSSCCGGSNASVDTPGAGSTNPTTEQLQSLKQTCMEMEAAITGVRQADQQPPLEDFCKIAMAQADDSPRDAQLNEMEYVVFLNLLSFGEWEGFQFDELPLLMQDIYVVNTGSNGLIQIFGARPGEEFFASAEQIQFLTDFCAATYEALGSVLGTGEPSSTPVATPAPTRQPSTPRPTTAPPTLRPTPRPTTLQPTTLQPTTLEPTTLEPTTLRPTTLEPTTMLPVTPVPTTVAPTTVQPLPTSAPSGSPSSLPTQDFSVFSEFMISNTIGLTAADFLADAGGERTTLDMSYNEMTRNSVEGLFGSQTNRRQTIRYLRQRRRRMVATHVVGSGRTETFTDIACLDSVDPNALCQVVGASFNVSLTEDENVTSVLQTTMEQVDADINSGKLQAILTELESAISVESLVTVAPTQSPVTAQPTVNPTSFPSTGTSSLAPTAEAPVSQPSRSPTLSPTPSGSFTGTVQVQIAFVTSNTIGITANDLGPESSLHKELEQALERMNSDVVAARNTSSEEFVNASTLISDIFDLPDCPDTAPPGSFCQSVFASYKVFVESVDPEPTILSLVDDTQQAIAAGALQAALEAVSSPFRIEEGAVPTRPPSGTPTVAPTPNPTEDGNRSGGSNTGAIVGAVVGVVAVLVILVACSLRVVRRRKAKDTGSDFYGAGKDSDLQADTYYDDEYRYAGGVEANPTLQGSTTPYGIMNYEATPYGMMDQEVSLRFQEVFGIDSTGEAPPAKQSPRGGAGAAVTAGAAVGGTFAAAAIYKPHESDGADESGSESEGDSDSDDSDSDDSDSDDSDSDDSSSDDSNSDSSEDGSVDSADSADDQSEGENVSKPRQATVSPVPQPPEKSGMNSVAAAAVGATTGAALVAAGGLALAAQESDSSGSEETDSESSGSESSGSETDSSDEEEDDDKKEGRLGEEAGPAGVLTSSQSPSFAASGSTTVNSGSTLAKSGESFANRSGTTGSTVAKSGSTLANSGESFANRSATTDSTFGNSWATPTFGDHQPDVPPGETGINPVAAGLLGAAVGAGAVGTVAVMARPMKDPGDEEDDSESESESTSGSEDSETDSHDESPAEQVDEVFNAWSQPAFAEPPTEAKSDFDGNVFPAGAAALGVAAGAGVVAALATDSSVEESDNESSGDSSSESTDGDSLSLSAGGDEDMAAAPTVYTAGGVTSPESHLKQIPSLAIQAQTSASARDNSGAFPASSTSSSDESGMKPGVAAGIGAATAALGMTAVAMATRHTGESDDEDSGEEDESSEEDSSEEDESYSEESFADEEEELQIAREIIPITSRRARSLASIKEEEEEFSPVSPIAAAAIESGRYSPKNYESFDTSPEDIARANPEGAPQPLSSDPVGDKSLSAGAAAGLGVVAGLGAGATVAAVEGGKSREDYPGSLNDDDLDKAGHRDVKAVVSATDLRDEDDSGSSEDSSSRPEYSDSSESGGSSTDLPTPTSGSAGFTDYTIPLAGGGEDDEVAATLSEPSSHEQGPAESTRGQDDLDSSFPSKQVLKAPPPSALPSGDDTVLSEPYSFDEEGDAEVAVPEGGYKPSISPPAATTVRAAVAKPNDAFHASEATTRSEVEEQSRMHPAAAAAAGVAVGAGLVAAGVALTRRTKPDKNGEDEDNGSSGVHSGSSDEGSSEDTSDDDSEEETSDEDSEEEDSAGDDLVEPTIVVTASAVAVGATAAAVSSTSRKDEEDHFGFPEIDKSEWESPGFAQDAFGASFSENAFGDGFPPTPGDSGGFPTPEGEGKDAFPDFSPSDWTKPPFVEESKDTAAGLNEAVMPPYQPPRSPKWRQASIGESNLPAELMNRSSVVDSSSSSDAMDALTSASSGEAVGLASMAETSGNARKAAVVGAAASAAAVAAMASRASENESESGSGDSEDSSEDNSEDGDEDGAREGFRSALDDSNESEENDFDEDESDDDTYDEGTHIQSVGTFEDTIADMNTEEAIAYVIAAAKRMEAESETADKSEDTGEFDRQMAAHQDPAPDMAGTDESEETSGDGEDTSSGDSDDSEETSSGDSDDSEETSEEETSSEENSDAEGLGPNAQAPKQGLLFDPSQFRRQLQIRQEVEELVRELVPEEVENLDAMFVQFAGREEELLNTLHTMRERRAKVRARAAVHKSKARPPPRLEQQRRRSSNGGPPPRGGAVDTQQGANLRAVSSSEASGTTPVPTSSRSYGSSSGSSSSSSSGSSSGSSGSSSSGSGQSSSS